MSVAILAPLEKQTCGNPGTVCDHRRAVTTFDHATGIMYFACDPNIVGVSVRTGEVTTSSPLVHWADGTQDAEFVSAMQFLH